MSENVNAVLALKNAWNGAILASDEVRALGPSVQALPETTDLAALDVETWHRLALTQANAAQALRGLVEQLRQLRQKETA